MSFGKETLIWKFYSTNKALPTTKRVQIINKTNIVIGALDADSKTFVVHMVIQE